MLITLGAVVCGVADAVGDRRRVPLPSAPRTLTGITRHDQQMPAPPRPLSGRAAMTPATIVPWPYWSEVSPVPSAKSAPGTSAPCRSGCVGSTPLSTTAITTGSGAGRDVPGRWSVDLRETPLLRPGGVGRDHDRRLRRRSGRLRRYQMRLIERALASRRCDFVGR